MKLYLFFWDPPTPLWCVMVLKSFFQRLSPMAIVCSFTYIPLCNSRPAPWVHSHLCIKISTERQHLQAYNWSRTALLFVHSSDRSDFLCFFWGVITRSTLTWILVNIGGNCSYKPPGDFQTLRGAKKNRITNISGGNKNLGQPTCFWEPF